MKKLLVCFVLVPFLFACNPAEKKGAVLTGKASNLSAGFFIMGGPGGGRDTVKLDAEGKFTFNVNDLAETAGYYILAGPQDYMPFKLAPGMKMDVTFDAAAFKTSIKFTGKGSDINNYLVTKMVTSGQMDYESFKLEPAQFRAKQDSTLAVAKALLSKTAKDNPADPFWKTEEAEVLFGWANNMQMFESYHGYLTQNQAYKAPEDFNSYQKDLDLGQSAYAASSAFKQYLSSMVYQAASKKAEDLKKADSTKTVNTTKIRMETAVELLKNEAVLNAYLFDDISGQVQWKEIEGEVQESIDFFLARCKDKALTDKLNTVIGEWKRLGKGEPAFEITGKDMQGNPVKLSDFKGKLVYVDVWATWCGPCKYEIPYLDTLETDYHGKDIVFISYSIDEDKDAWLKFVPEHKLQGVQIIGEKAWESKL